MGVWVSLEQFQFQVSLLGWDYTFLNHDFLCGPVRALRLTILCLDRFCHACASTQAWKVRSPFHVSRSWKIANVDVAVVRARHFGLVYTIMHIVLLLSTLAAVLHIYISLNYIFLKTKKLIFQITIQEYLKSATESMAASISFHHLPTYWWNSLKVRT